MDEKINKEMEFKEWTEFLTKLLRVSFQINIIPAPIKFRKQDNFSGNIYGESPILKCIKQIPINDEV
jgi:hypothetical protein